MEFEWDDHKAADNREEYGELRFKTVGMAQGRLLVVVYTYRQQHIRIISARKAERYERRKYHEGEAGS